MKQNSGPQYVCQSVLEGVPVFRIRCIQKDWDTLFFLGGYIVDALRMHCVACVAGVHKDMRQYQHGLQRWLQPATTVFALGQHDGKRRLFPAGTQSNAKHCNVKCNQSVSNVISMHRAHCGSTVHAFGIHE